MKIETGLISANLYCRKYKLLEKVPFLTDPVYLIAQEKAIYEIIVHTSRRKLGISVRITFI